MADLDIAIAGRNYRVACADGEEDNLTRAAALLAEEAETLRAQFGGRFAALPESRVLLMASLMLGDRFRATLDAGAAEPGALAAEPAEPAAGQPGFFDDPELAARVEARFMGGEHWLPGTIKECDGDGMYAITFYDGSEDDPVREDHIRRPIVADQ